MAQRGVLQFTRTEWVVTGSHYHSHRMHEIIVCEPEVELPEFELSRIQRQRLGAESHFELSPAYIRTLSRFPHISAQPVVFRTFSHNLELHLGGV